MAEGSSVVLATILTFVAWFIGFYLYHGLGITLGYHRLLSHKALTVPKWLSYLIVSGGYFCLQGGPVVWVGVHRLHHQKTDMPGDPHAPEEGFIHALFGWMLGMKDKQSSEDLHRLCPDLMADPIYSRLGSTHNPMQAYACLAANIAFRLLILYFFGWIALAADLLASGMVFWSPQLVNTICHMPSMGYRLNDTRDKSRNVWWVALLALGEGWHNNHHAVPKSARHGFAWWEIDVTWYAVWVLEKLGLSKNIVRPPKHIRSNS
ncbi:MAG: acyl-CoA desaturase [Candidatus Obscuribacterales bacterium]|nr:acyl-CoA desaturase [Candidatus Obscuribacterales bacterium]